MTKIERPVGPPGEFPTDPFEKTSLTPKDLPLPPHPSFSLSSENQDLSYNLLVHQFKPLEPSNSSVQLLAQKTFFLGFEEIRDKYHNCE